MHLIQRKHFPIFYSTSEANILEFRKNVSSVLIIVCRYSTIVDYLYTILSVEETFDLIKFAINKVTRYCVVEDVTFLKPLSCM